MTPSSDMVEAGRRLASDLRRIRELRGVSIDTLIEKTKASPDVLSSFESDSLVEHPMYNRVYLRSFIRTYAEIVEIDPDLAVGAADQLLEGRYDGSLAAKYLDEGAKEVSGEPVIEEEGTEPAIPDGKRAEPEPDVDAAPETGAGEDPADLDEEPVEAGSESAMAGDSESAAEPAPEKDEGEVRRGTEKETEGARRSWPVSGPAGGRPAMPAFPGPSWLGRVLWLVPVVVVLALAAVVLFGREEPAERVSVAPSEPVPVTPLPPARLDTFHTVRVDLPPRIVLGDTVELWVVAAADTLNPVRIKADDDLRRPYWVEIGDSTLVRFTERVVLERETDVLALSVAGRRVPADRFVAGQSIELDRATLQEMLDSLRTVQ